MVQDPRQVHPDGELKLHGFLYLWIVENILLWPNNKLKSAYATGNQL